MVVGLTLFVYGLNLGLFPIGENMAYAFASKGIAGWLLTVAFTSLTPMIASWHTDFWCDGNFHPTFYTILDIVWDVLPFAVIIFGFQFLVLRKAVPNLKRIVFGFLLVSLGLGFFLEGLQAALFPLGQLWPNS